MDYWTHEVLSRLMQRVENDEEHQLLLMQCRNAEMDYLTIMERISEEDRLIIEEYISICEDMEYRKTQLAYEMGLFDSRIIR